MSPKCHQGILRQICFKSPKTMGGFLMHYNVLRRSIKNKNKSVYRWYYSFVDPLSGIKKQKVIPDCRNRSEAYSFIQSLPDLEENKIYLKDICKDMFIPGSDHLERLFQHGKKLSFKTIHQYRALLDLVVKVFGDIELKNITVTMVDEYLRTTIDRSGSWKNSFLETLGYVYNEAPFLGCNNIQKPNFQRFARNSKKADIFTTEELNAFFNQTLWTSERDFLLFLCMASFGLRLGEARALQRRQFIFDKNSLIIDGFCKKDGERTSYNKKGSDENKKWRVAIAPDLTMRLVNDFILKNNIQDNDFVFTKDGFLPLRYEYLESVFKRQITKTGIIKGSRKLIPHSFRFTYVTRMRRELPAEMVQKIVGHSSVEMTEYYTRAAIPEMVQSLQNAVPAVNQLFE